MAGSKNKALELQADAHSRKADCNIKARSKYKILKLLIALALICIAGAALYLGLGSARRQSLHAYLDGGVIEISALTSGVVQDVARPGGKVQAGEVLLQMEALDYAREALETDKKVKELAASVPARYSSVLAAYLAIPQGEDELALLVEAAAQDEKQARDQLEAISARQAAFALQVRAIELKGGNTAQDKEKLKNMLAEEELLQMAVQKAYVRHEEASLTRADFEKQLTRKQNWGRTLRAAPQQIQGPLAQLREAFKQMYELERRILDSVITAPQDGLVLFTLLKSGDKAAKGDTALYFAPASQQEMWVTAYFTPKLAAKLQTGQCCAVTMGHPDNPLRLEGRVGALPGSGTASTGGAATGVGVPHAGGGTAAGSATSSPGTMAGTNAASNAGTSTASNNTQNAAVSAQNAGATTPAADGSIPVRILLPDLRPERLIGLNPKQNITVTPE